MEAFVRFQLTKDNFTMQLCNQIQCAAIAHSIILKSDMLIKVG